MRLARLKYIMMRKGNVGVALGAAFVLLFYGTVFAQVFRGYYPGGRQVQVQSSGLDGKKIIKSYYPGGKIEAIYEYEKEKLNGTVRQYFENGVLKAEIKYRDDKRQGQAKYYYSSGMLMARVEYDNDTETGVSRFYDENGRPMKARSTKDRTH